MIGVRHDIFAQQRSSGFVHPFFGQPTSVEWRQSQSPFAIFTGQKLHGDEMVQKAQAYLETTVEEKISVEDLSSRFAIGRRNFD